MAPAGSFESLAAALQGGADSVYFGVGKLNMRSRATANFSEEDLPEIVARCHEAGAKAYLTLNIIVYDEELEAVHALCGSARKAGVDAVIASDLAVIAHARSIGLEVHMSVQANVCNMASVRFYAQYADVVVLARELTLAQITSLWPEPVLLRYGTPLVLRLGPAGVDAITRVMGFLVLAIGVELLVHGLAAAFPALA